MKLDTICIYEVSVYNWDSETQQDVDNIDCDYYAYTQWVGADKVLADNLGEPIPNTVVYVYEARGGNVIVGKSGKIECFDDVDTATGMNGSPIHTVYYNNEGKIYNPYD